MLKSITLSILFTCLFLSIYMLLPAQAKKGFQYLEQENTKAAIQAFEQQQSHKKWGAPAHYGLSLIMLKYGEDISDHLAAYAHVEKAEGMAQQLSFGKRRKYRKKEWLPANLNGLEKEVQDSIVAYLSVTESLSDIDSLFDFLEDSRSRRLRGNAKREFESLRQQVVKRELREAEDYATLHSLATRHRHIIMQNSYLFAGNLDWRMLNAFIQEFGEENLGRFVDENPNHYISRDCWIEQYLAAVKQESIIPVLDFLNDYPLSILNRLAIRRAIRINDSRNERETLTGEQRLQLESIELGDGLNRRLYLSAPLDSAFHEQLLKYIESCAPSTRAYFLMEEALQRYLNDKQWAFAEGLAVQCQPWFPDDQPENCKTFYDYYSYKQPWFSVAIPILKRPADGVEINPMAKLNTWRGDEYSPVPSSDGRTIYFAGSGRPDNIKGEDVFVSYWKQDSWSAPVLVENLSGEANFVPLSLTADGNEMLVFVDGKLHVSQRTATGWSVPEELPDALNAFPWIGRAVFADNGRVIVMSASKGLEEIDRESDTDIFVALKDQFNKWGMPFSVGDSINTPKQERSPFLHTDGYTLYFSSNGHKGLGGMDVYKSTRLDNSWKKWTAPVNMGKEINKLEDDWGYNYSVSTNGKVAFLSSAGEYGGQYDLYTTGMPQFTRPRQLTVLKMYIKTDSERPLPFVARDSTGRIVGRALSQPDGSVDIAIPSDVKGKITIESPNKSFLLVPVGVELTGGLDVIPLPDTIEMYSTERLILHKKGLELSEIFFEKDSFNIRLEAARELEAFYQMIRSRQLSIEIAGFADPDGSEAYNKELSQKRAEAVRQKLIELGYPPENITAVGYGEQKSGAGALSDAEKAKYRKVEVRIMEEVK